MSSAGAELEACLLVLGTQRAQWCSALESNASLGSLTSGKLERRELCDTYFDSAAQGQLKAAEMALRLRRQTVGGVTSELLTWKGKGQRKGASGVERAELEAPATRGFLQQLFAVLRDAGIEAPEAVESDSTRPEDWLLSAGFQPVQSRSTERSAVLLVDAKGEARCELAIDRVTYLIARRRVVHYELELEAVGEAQLVEVEGLANELISQHRDLLRPWPWSKTALARALEQLEERGELAALLVGDTLNPEGYDAIETRLLQR